jgi:hypothetical protein
MDGWQFAAVAKTLANARSRRTVLFALTALSLGSVDAVAKNKKKQQKKKEATKRVNTCLKEAPPSWCPYAPGSSFQTQCVNEITDCCYQAKYSRGAFCSCASTRGWGQCV